MLIQTSGRFPTGTLVILLVAFAPAVLLAQNPNQQPGVTVQLPVQAVFNINTVVSVPDGGSTYLGGVNGYSSTNISRGVPGLSSIPGANRLFRNQGIGNAANAGGASAHVRILIQDELEAEVMGRARQMIASQALTDPNGSPELQARADYLTRNIGRAAGTSIPASPQRYAFSSNLSPPEWPAQESITNSYPQTGTPARQPAYPYAGPSTGPSLEMPVGASSSPTAPIQTNAPLQTTAPIASPDPAAQTPDGFRRRSFNGTRFNNRR